jgi:nucleotide-binding universal stress UspA family protein
MRAICNLLATGDRQASSQDELAIRYQDAVASVRRDPRSSSVLVISPFLDPLALLRQNRETELAMRGYQNILIYYDGSEEAESALRRVGGLGSALTAQIHVITVADMASAIAWSAGMLSHIAYDRLESTARLVLDEALDTMTQCGIVAAGHMAYGNVVDSIVKRADLLNADVIVVGHRRRRGLARWWSTSPTHAELLERASGRAVMAVPTE